MRTIPTIYDMEQSQPVNARTVSEVLKYAFFLIVLTIGEPDLLGAIVRLILKLAR